eukprot:GGOE01030667.1.p1 GENE.GGOE01030667.1~~GGOE01030667.1.p1  ORF type:complete len:806 (+),score=258.82 GGOE01030667.1:77-2419(+)
MAQNVQEMLMSQAVGNFNLRLTEGENEILAWQALVHSSGMLECDLRPSRFDFQNRLLIPYETVPFASMKGHPLFATVAISGAILRNQSTVGPRIFLLTVSSSFVDVAKNVTGNRTLYLGTMAMTADEKYVLYNTYYINQVTAVEQKVMKSQIVPSSYLTMKHVASGWDTELSFNEYSGQVQLSRWVWLPAKNDTWIQVFLSIGAETLSDELKSQLSDSPDDRLVLFFRQPHGYMIAASHGKYWSDSDVDHRFVNTITNPLNISAYHLWTCLQSNDDLIQQACQQIYGTYQSWTAIPALRQEMILSGQRYWVATDFSTSSASLQCTVLMLKNRASVMGKIDAGNTEVDESVSDKKGITFIVLGVVSALAAIMPLAVGLWLASRLYRLAAAMDRIAKLEFATTSPRHSMFQELHRFQTSFAQMERGLQAFGKFVPQTVVKVLITGRMRANEEMSPEMVTIMFADIEGFSVICEGVPPTVLVKVCTEYFETMCNTIVQRNGTIDKFIGDCIMAMWNAPEPMPGHEKDAVATSLAMQSNVMDLHSSWHRQGLPLLKPRIGIHTGMCLVGNFGCSYRVSYTCLGDGVNLSARLEALNKKFGTFICVSHATYQACFNDFHFRRLAKVTVPGKAEVLPVYEVLCEVDEATRTKLCCPKEIDAPGTINAGEPSRMSLNSVHGSGYVHVLNDPSHDGSTGRKLNHPDANQNQVPYHWAYVDRTQLLRQAREYEEAYQAMVAGDQARARQLLRSKPTMDVADKSWASLGAQLEHTEAGQPWDGVFYFHEK